NSVPPQIASPPRDLDQEIADELIHATWPRHERPLVRQVIDRDVRLRRPLLHRLHHHPRQDQLRIIRRRPSTPSASLATSGMRLPRSGVYRAGRCSLTRKKLHERTGPVRRNTIASRTAVASDRHGSAPRPRYRSPTTVSRQYCDHSAWQSPSCRRASLRNVQRTSRVGSQSHVGLRYRDDEAIRRVANHHLAPGDEARRRRPARVGNRAMIKISHSVTNDIPDGRPWPPPDSNALWAVVRRADGCTVWRAIHLVMSPCPVI